MELTTPKPDPKSLVVVANLGRRNTLVAPDRVAPGLLNGATAVWFSDPTRAATELRCPSA